MRFLIVGAGAIGSLVGGRLALAGHRVTLVGREATVRALRTLGLRVVEDGQTTITRQVSAAASLAEAFSAAQRYDLACLTVKSYDTATAAAELAAATSSPPSVVTFQNGVGNEQMLIERFGAARVLSATITAPVQVLEPGMVSVARSGRVDLSPTDPGGSVLGLNQALAEAGFDVRLHRDYRALKWSKLLMNMIGNATCAILDWSPTRVFADRRLCALEMQAVREGMDVMSAEGIRLARVGSYPVPLVAPLLTNLPPPLLQPLLLRIIGNARGGKTPSLHIDLRRGRGKSEVDVLNGAICRAGARLGLHVPANQALHAALMALTRREVAWDHYRDKPERLLSEAGLAG
jgi:2-dehydropantoate 2-reductase